MNKHIERIINPQTGLDWMVALNDPNSPAYKTLTNLITEEALENRALELYFERYMAAARNESLQQRLVAYKEAVALENLQQQTILHNAKIMSRAAQPNAGKDISLTEQDILQKQNTISKLKDKIQVLNAKLEFVKTKIKDIGQTWQNLQKREVSQLVEMFNQDGLAFVDINGNRLAAERCVHIVENAMKQTSIEDMKRVNPVQYKDISENGFAKYEDAKTLAGELSMLFALMQSDYIAPSKLLKLVEKNEGVLDNFVETRKANRDQNIKFGDAMVSMHHRHDELELGIGDLTADLNKLTAELNESLIAKQSNDVNGLRIRPAFGSNK